MGFTNRPFALQPNRGHHATMMEDWALDLPSSGLATAVKKT